MAATAGTAAGYVAVAEHLLLQESTHYKPYLRLVGGLVSAVHQSPASVCSQLHSSELVADRSSSLTFAEFGRLW